VNDIEDAFGIVEQVDAPPAVETSREQQLTELHQVKADALATVRPLKDLTIKTHGLKKIVEGRKAVVKLRTSIDKRRKLLNEEAKKWIDTVNGVAKEIGAIIEPVEIHLKHQEALHEEQQRQAAEAERVERVAVRRMSWSENAGPFPEAEAGSLTALEWTSFTFERLKAENARRQEEQQRADERAELGQLRRLKTESDRREAEAEAERRRTEAAARHAEQDQQAAEAEQSRIARIAKMWDNHEQELAVTEAAIEADILPLSTPIQDQAKPVVYSVSDKLTKFEELKSALRELLQMQGDVDWRGMIREALEDAAA
jgi:colicin import membrane protein